MFPTLETERLILREITERDAEDLFACFSHDLVTRYYGQETLTSLEQAKGFVDFFSKKYTEKAGIRWGIERKGTKGLIGTVGFNVMTFKHKRADIGYEIHPDYWRCGYTMEAVKEIVNYGFDSLNLERIGAIVFVENKPSSNLLVKIGFEKEGVLRKYMYQNGIAHDVFVYSLLK